MSGRNLRQETCKSREATHMHLNTAAMSRTTRHYSPVIIIARSGSVRFMPLILVEVRRAIRYISKLKGVRWNITREVNLKNVPFMV